MTMREKIVELLMDNPRLRDNDLMLIAYYIRDMYGLQNTFDIALSLNGNIYESIRRERQKIQETNPTLKASARVQELRDEKEQRTRERMRGV